MTISATIALSLCAFIFSLFAFCLAAVAWLELRAMKNSTHKFVFGTPPPVDLSEPLRPLSPEELKATSTPPFDHIT